MMRDGKEKGMRGRLCTAVGSLMYLCRVCGAQGGFSCTYVLQIDGWAKRFYETCGGGMILCDVFSAFLLLLWIWLWILLGLDGS
jgi:hypothetical protein